MPAPSPSQAEPVTAATARGGEGGAQHLALEAEIDDAGPLAEETAQRREDERRREAQGRGEQGDELDEILGHADIAARAPSSLARPGRNMFSSAPQNRMTRPSIMTMSSPCNFGISKARALPP